MEFGYLILAVFLGYVLNPFFNAIFAVLENAYKSYLEEKEKSEDENPFVVKSKSFEPGVVTFTSSNADDSEKFASMELKYDCLDVKIGNKNRLQIFRDGRCVRNGQRVTDNEKIFSFLENYFSTFVEIRDSNKDRPELKPVIPSKYKDPVYTKHGKDLGSITSDDDFILDLNEIKKIHGDIFRLAIAPTFEVEVEKDIYKTYITQTLKVKNVQEFFNNYEGDMSKLYIYQIRLCNKGTKEECCLVRYVALD